MALTTRCPHSQLQSAGSLSPVQLIRSRAGKKDPSSSGARWTSRCYLGSVSVGNTQRRTKLKEKEDIPVVASHHGDRSDESRYDVGQNETRTSRSFAIEDYCGLWMPTALLGGQPVLYIYRLKCS